jgi:Mg2+ and Co2+ transporter CorA
VRSDGDHSPDHQAPLQFHPLTVEDAFETRTPPKIADFGKYL